MSGFGLAFNNSDEERGFYYPKRLQINTIHRLRCCMPSCAHVCRRGNTG